MPENIPAQPEVTLETLALERFRRRATPAAPPEFTAAERNLLTSAPKGAFAYCGPSYNFIDPTNDPSLAEQTPENPGWGAEREIDADLIRWLCVDRKAREQVDPKGIQVQGARINGYLDLSFVVLPFPLVFWRCFFTADAWLNQLEIPSINFEGSWTKSLSADGAVIKGGVFLRYGFRSSGVVRFLGARIDGNLECDGSTFYGAEGFALYADNANIKGYVFLRNKFTAYGEVNLLCAKIGASLECEGGTFVNPTRRAINAAGVQVGDTLVMAAGFNSWGEVSVSGAQIAGTFNCSGGAFDNPGGYALYADGLETRGYVLLRNKFRAQGEVSLLGAQIGANLECDDAVFSSTDRPALNAERVNVKGHVFLRYGFSCQGTIILLGAHIEGGLNCVLADFWNAYLDLRDASVSFIGDDPESWPQGGRLLLDGCVYGRFSGGPSDAESRLKWLALRPAVYFLEERKKQPPPGQGLTPSGRPAPKTDAPAGTSPAAPAGATPAADEGRSTTAPPASVPADSEPQPASRPAPPAPAKTIPAAASQGVPPPPTYSVPPPSNQSVAPPANPAIPAAHHAPVPAAQALQAPLSRRRKPSIPQAEKLFATQPYLQLAKVLREAGDDDGAVTVMEEMERLRRKKVNQGRPDRRLWSFLYEVFAGYGYDPIRAFLAVVLLLGIGWVLYSRGYRAGSMAPTDKDAYNAFRLTGQLPGNYEEFDPFVYSLENSLPLVKLGQADKWQPDPKPSASAAHARISPRVLRWFLGIQILLGWLLASLFAAGITGIVRKD